MQAFGYAKQKVAGTPAHVPGLPLRERGGATGKLIPTRKGGMPGRWIFKEKVGKGYIWSKNCFERRRS
jgi:hypothetical protein